jgi:hypothetical protein
MSNNNNPFLRVLTDHAVMINKKQKKSTTKRRFSIFKQTITLLSFYIKKKEQRIPQLQIFEI